jgi:ABC-2 type transport system permease protein
MIGIIIRREYVTRIRKTSFILSTVLTPLLFAALGGVLLFPAGYGAASPDIIAFAGGEGQPLREAATAVGLVYMLLIYSFILIYGRLAMLGVMEEKTGRIIEIIVSSVKPVTLMLGKLAGIGLAGVTQFAVWLSVLLFMRGMGLWFAGGEAVFRLAGEALVGVDLAGLSLYFAVFFVGGYLIYASLFAAVGAIVDSAEDAQQYQTPLLVALLFALYAGIEGAHNPEGGLAFWASLFPLTAPVVMMVRIPHGVNGWELLLSAVLLYGSIIPVIKAVAKIYRTGILMYGKKPTLRELIKWLKY